MGWLYGVTVDIEAASALVDFEVIEIADNNNLYRAPLGIDWDFDMDAIINLKKRKMNFERKVLRVIVPLDLMEGSQYIEPIHDFVEDDDDLDQIYKITMWDKYYINPTTDGWIVWDKDSSCTLDSDEELKHW